ncbi:MAG TPA: hypothetical protein VEJ63_21880 [Planctomycetota bacterium]|nr:hypothetical protein [Planctomycetota bacterium]
MAKRRSRWPEDDDVEEDELGEPPGDRSRADDPEEVDLDEDAEEGGEDASESRRKKKSQPEPGDKSRDFFQTIGDGLKSAGKTAEKYAKMGISAAALEKQRLDLRLAYAKLGEAVHRCWTDAPDLGVAATDPSVRAHVKAVNDLRRRIRETEIKLRELRKS